MTDTPGITSFFYRAGKIFIRSPKHLLPFMAYCLTLKSFEYPILFLFKETTQFLTRQLPTTWDSLIDFLKPALALIFSFPLFAAPLLFLLHLNRNINTSITDCTIFCFARYGKLVLLALLLLGAFLVLAVPCIVLLLYAIVFLMTVKGGNPMLFHLAIGCAVVLSTPFLLLALRLLPTVPLFLDTPGIGLFKAFQTSWRITRRHTWHLFRFALVCALIMAPVIYYTSTFTFRINYLVYYLLLLFQILLCFFFTLAFCAFYDDLTGKTNPL